MVEEGRWRALAPDVKGHASFRINCLVAPFEPARWGKLAEEFTQAARRPEVLRTFCNTVLGEVWRTDEDEGPQPHELMELAAPVDLDRIPSTVLWLCSGVDVQTSGGGRLEIATLGFSADDEWIVLDHRVLYGDPAKDAVWADLADVITERHPHGLGGSIQRSAVCVDAADGHVMDRVLAFAAGQRSVRCIPIKGAPGQRPPLTPTASKRSRSLMVAGVDGAKQRLYDRLTRRSGITFSDNLPQEWFFQLTSERAVVRYSRGRPTRQWERYPGRAGEALDAVTYSLIARAAIIADPARRAAELASKTALQPVRPTVIRSAWLERHPY
jgi:phage terminase large subunit GpA-like protein